MPTIYAVEARTTYDHEYLDTHTAVGLVGLYATAEEAIAAMEAIELALHSPSMAIDEDGEDVTDEDGNYEPYTDEAAVYALPVGEALGAYRINDYKQDLRLAVARRRWSNEQRAFVTTRF